MINEPVEGENLSVCGVWRWTGQQADEKNSLEIVVYVGTTRSIGCEGGEESKHGNCCISTSSSYTVVVLASIDLLMFGFSFVDLRWGYICLYYEWIRRRNLYLKGFNMDRTERIQFNKVKSISKSIIFNIVIVGRLCLLCNSVKLKSLYMKNKYIGLDNLYAMTID